MDQSADSIIESQSSLEKPTRNILLERIAMIFLGFINNLFFYIVGTSSQNICLHFNQKGWIGGIGWATSICGLFASTINAGFSSYSVSYDIRYIITSLCNTIGLVGLAIAPNFWISLVCLLFIGFGCNFGESVSIGYLADIQKQDLIEYWGIGTGVSGIFGSLYSFCIIYFGFNYTYSFYVLIPFVIIYLLSYFLVLRKKKVKPLNEIHLLSKSDADMSYTNTQNNENDNTFSFCSTFYHILYYIGSIDCTYFLQYTISYAFLDCAQNPKKPLKKYLYPLLSLSNHIAVLIFASTLSCFEISRLFILTFIQCLNFILWLTQALFHWMPLWSQFIFTFGVGIIAGLSYVNTYNEILKDKKLKDKEKELGSNITVCSVTISVLVASGFSVLAEKTFLKNQLPTT